MEGNRKAVTEICMEVIDKGYLPISPINMFDFIQDEKDLRDDILQVCYDLIDICDEVWVYGCSTGCKFEDAYARLMGKKVIRKIDSDKIKIFAAAERKK